MGWICDSKQAALSLARTMKEFQKSSQRLSGYSVKFENSPFSIRFGVIHGKKEIATFTLMEMINCCGILVSTKTSVAKEFQGQGIAQEMMLLKEALAKEYGYSSMLATVNVSGNPAEVHILEKNGWTCVNKFVNSRTKNTVGVFVKNL